MLEVMPYFSSPEHIDGIVDLESMRRYSAHFKGRQRDKVSLDEINFLHDLTRGSIMLPPAKDHHTIFLTGYHRDSTSWGRETYVVESPLIISDIVDLDDVAVFEVGVHTPGHHDLVLVYCRCSSFHDVKEHGSDQLPLLCHYVVSHADLGDLPELGIEAAQKVDETLVVGDCLLLYALQLQLVRALRFLKKDLIVVVEEV
jgi:hypothetical protein